MYYLKNRWVQLLIIILLFAARGFAGSNAYEIDFTKLNWEEQAMFAALQGIVNRTGPNVFVYYTDDDHHWSSYYSSKFGMTFNTLSDPYSLFKIYASQIKGYVIWDYDNVESINIATTLAGLNDWVIVSPLLKARMDSLGIPLKRDLRNNFTDMNKAQIYDWEFNNYFSGCSKKYVTNLTTGNAQWIDEDISSYVKGDSVFVRFEDAVKTDGNGTKLRCVEILNNGNRVAYFQVGSPDEVQYLYSNGYSWFDPDGDRIADATQYFTYRFKIPNPGKVTLRFIAFNQYMVKAGSTPVPTTILTYETSKIGNTMGGNVERDMAVFFRSMCYDLSNRQVNYPDEYAVKEKIMDATDHPSVELGWVSYLSGRDDEGTYVSQASKHGNVVLCCGTPNISFHIWMKPAKLTPPAQLPVPAIDTSKIYVSFLLSDGDALHWDGRLQGGQWLSNLRGSIPFGWEIQPLLYDLAPGMLQYYYETAVSKDEFVAAASGIGYCHPEEFPADRLETYLNTTKNYLLQTGLKTISILSASNVPFEVAEKYKQTFSDLGINCQEGYRGLLAGGYPFTNFSLWRTQTPLTGLSRDTILLELNNIAKTKTSAPLFVPVHPTCYNAGFEDIKWVVDNLDPNKFVVVTPSQLLRMVSNYYKGGLLTDKPDDVVPLLNNGQIIVPVEFRTVIDNTADVNIRFNIKGSNITISKENKVQSRQDILSNADFLINTSGITDSFSTADVSYSSGMFNKTYSYPIMQMDYQPAAGYYCLGNKSWNAVNLSHRFGQKVNDADAIGGDAWYAAKNISGAPNHLVFGPYAFLAEGDYVACFRLKVDALTSSEIAGLEVYDYIAGNLTLGGKQISGSDFPSAGKYKNIYIPFHHNGIGAIETRIYDTGAAGIWADEIVLLKLEKTGSITGQQQGNPGDTLSFSVRAFDANNDSVAVRFNWADKDTSEWTEYYPSGYEFTLLHYWPAPGKYAVRYQTRSVNGTLSNWGDTLMVTISNVSGVNNNKSKIFSYSLNQNYPNPFNPSTTISWQLPSGSNVTLKVYDMLGNEVATLVNEYQNAGVHSIIFNSQQIAKHKQLSSGVYFYRISAVSTSGQMKNFIETKKLLLLK